MIVKNKKSGKLYRASGGTIINTTNNANDQQMVFYTDRQGKLFVREVEEFWRKFVLIGIDDPRVG